MRGSARVVASAIAILAIVASAQVHRVPLTDPVPVRVSGLSPFFGVCQPQQKGTVFIHAAVEPHLASDPTNPQHLVGVWQQDRWLGGAATATLTAVSFDGGHTWKQSDARMSQCSGGPLALASDPWVTISPNGTVYQAGLGVAIGTNQNDFVVLVSRSHDGGLTWENPAVLSHSNGDDKETIIADPNDSRYVYAVWDRSGSTSTANWFARSVDGGASWEPSRLIYDPGLNTFAGFNQIVVLPDGTLVDVFILSKTTSTITAMRSTDHGLTWSAPIPIAQNKSVGVVDSRTQIGVRSGSGIPKAAVDPISGTIYVVWEDARFSNGVRQGIAMSKSKDGGLSWSAPVQVNQIPQVQAFTPAIAVAVRNSLTGPKSMLGITYFDFRQVGDDLSKLPTSYWQIVSNDEGATWEESGVVPPFDMLRSALSGVAHFIGDYHGLAASGDRLVKFFASTATGDDRIPSSIFAIPVMSQRRVDGSSWNGRVEVNLNPRTFQPHVPRRR